MLWEFFDIDFAEPVCINAQFQFTIKWVVNESEFGILLSDKCKKNVALRFYAGCLLV